VLDPETGERGAFFGGEKGVEIADHGECGISDEIGFGDRENGVGGGVTAGNRLRTDLEWRSRLGRRSQRDSGVQWSHVPGTIDAGLTDSEEVVDTGVQDDHSDEIEADS
jgi:hypothetical protein